MVRGADGKAKTRLDKMLMGEDPDAPTKMSAEEIADLDESWGTSPEAAAGQAKMLAWAGGEG